MKDIALNGLPFVDAGEILQCGEVRAVEGLEAEWSSAAKALKKSRGVIKRNSSIGVRRRSDSSSSICTMVQSAASGIPAKVFGLCVGYDSVAVIGMYHPSMFSCAVDDTPECRAGGALSRIVVGVVARLSITHVLLLHAVPNARQP